MLRRMAKTAPLPAALRHVLSDRIAAGEGPALEERTALALPTLVRAAGGARCMPVVVRTLVAALTGEGAIARPAALLAGAAAP
jgi:hypothetical protein